MYAANDNATEKLISFQRNTPDKILRDPISLLGEDLYSDLYYILEEEGFDVDDIEMMRDLAVVGEVINAMLARGVGEYHPYQDFLNQVSIAHDPTPAE